MSVGKLSLKLLCVQALLGFAWTPVVNAQVDFHANDDLFSAYPDAKTRLPGDSLDEVKRKGPRTLSEVLNLPARATASKVPTPFVAHPQLPKAEPKPAAIVSADEEAEILKEAELMLKHEILAASPDIKAPSAASQQARAKIRVTARDRKLKIEPSTLEIGLETASVDFVGLEGQPQIFLRDASKLSWDSEHQRFKAKAMGSTEIFIIYFDEMYILPVTIGTGSARPDLLSGQPALQHLTSVLPLEKDAYARFQPTAPQSQDIGTPRDISIADASLEAKETLTQTAAEQSRFVYDGGSKAYKDMAIQVMDLRSNPAEGRIYPVSGVTVQLLGTGMNVKTDAAGLARFGELPVNGRVWALLANEDGSIIPTAGELLVSGKGEVQRMRTMSYQTYVSYMNIWGTNQDWSKGSICARALDSSGREALDGLSVQVNDEQADGPYYFSSYGPQPGLAKTDSSGRFCFFNVNPGLTELSFFDGNEFVSALTLPIFPGAHSEEDLPLETGRGRQLYLASMSTAMDQLYGDDNAALFLESVPSANVIGLGENSALDKVNDYILGESSGHSEFKGRLYSLVQTAEFENTLQAHDSGRAAGEIPVLPLLQRGFVEDLFQELNQAGGDHASLAFEPSLGQVLVYHHLNGESSAEISITDVYGKVVENGWTFGSPAQGLVKAAFFNLQPGMYTVKVQKANGALLSIDTIAVDFWTTGVVQSGGDLHFNTSSQAVSDAAE